MPAASLWFNCSEDCVLIHHGIATSDDVARVLIMQKLAIDVKAILEARFPGWHFVPKSAIAPSAYQLLAVDFSSEDRDRPEVAKIREIVDDINGDITRLVDMPCVLRSLPNDVIGPYSHFSRVGIAGVQTIVRVVGEVLLLVADIVPLSEVDVLLWVGPGFKGFWGRARMFPSEDLKTAIGYRIKVRTPSSLGVVLHEAAHVVVGMNDPQGMDEVSGPDEPEECHGHHVAFVSALSAIVKAADASGLEERVKLILSEDPPQSFPQYVRRADIVDGGRWRMFVEGDAGYATWCLAGADRWGEGTVANDRFLSSLPDGQRAFCLLSVGRHPSQLCVSDSGLGVLTVHDVSPGLDGPVPDPSDPE